MYTDRGASVDFCVLDRFVSSIAIGETVVAGVFESGCCHREQRGERRRSWSAAA